MGGGGGGGGGWGQTVTKYENYDFWPKHASTSRANQYLLHINSK